MKEITHIIPVGHTKETLIEGMRQYPFHRIYLVLGKDNKSEGAIMARKTAAEIEKVYQKIAKIVRVELDEDNVISSTLEIIEIINKEKKEGNEVKINASGSLRTIGISCYIAASITKTPIYVALPEYRDEKIVGVKKVIEIPLFPHVELIEERQEIVRALNKHNEIGSIDELIRYLNQKLDKSNTNLYLKERARVSYHIKKLREEGFIETEKEGKNLRLRLTDMGKIYALGMF